jgi:hypothetical protein
MAEGKGGEGELERSGCFRTNVRNRLLQDMIRLSRPGGGGSAKYLVLVLDHRTTRVLSSALSMFDVMQEGLALVESLEKSRQPMPEMEVIYFIEPSERSIQMVCDDFADPKKPKYGARGGRWWDWVVVVVVKRGRVVCVCVTVMRTG